MCGRESPGEGEVAGGRGGAVPAAEPITIVVREIYRRPNLKRRTLARRRPRHRALEARRELELCEPQLPPQRLVRNPALEAAEEALRLGLAGRPLFREQPAEIEGRLEVEGVDGQHLPEQHDHRLPMLAAAQLLPSVQERLHGIDALSPADLLVRDPLPVLHVLGEVLRRRGPDGDRLFSESLLEESLARRIEALSRLVPLARLGEERRHPRVDVVIRRIVLEDGLVSADRLADAASASRAVRLIEHGGAFVDLLPAQHAGIVRKDGPRGQGADLRATPTSGIQPPQWTASPSWALVSTAVRWRCRCATASHTTVCSAWTSIPRRSASPRRPGPSSRGRIRTRLRSILATSSSSPRRRRI